MPVIAFVRDFESRTNLVFTRGNRGKRHSRYAERGYVLLWTLAAIALLTLLATLLIQATERRLDGRGQRHELLAMAAARDAAVARLRADLVSTRAEPMLLPASGSSIERNVEVTWRLTVESDRYDINRASPVTLAALLAELGLKPALAEQLAGAIADWRDEDELRHPNGAEASEYEAAGIPGPANALFLDVSELAGVMGFTPAIVACVSPYLTVFGTGDGGRAPGAPETKAQARAGDAVRMIITTRYQTSNRTRTQTQILRITGAQRDPLWLIDVAGHSGEAPASCQQP